ncbi:hypothetical protein LXL04_034410 [Taraxacum kok-saghyz]
MKNNNQRSQPNAPTRPYSLVQQLSPFFRRAKVLPEGKRRRCDGGGATAVQRSNSNPVKELVGVMLAPGLDVGGDLPSSWSHERDKRARDRAAVEVVSPKSNA